MSTRIAPILLLLACVVSSLVTAMAFRSCGRNHIPTQLDMHDDTAGASRVLCGFFTARSLSKCYAILESEISSGDKNGVILAALVNPDILVRASAQGDVGGDIERDIAYGLLITLIQDKQQELSLKHLYALTFSFSNTQSGRLHQSTRHLGGAMFKSSGTASFGESARLIVERRLGVNGRTAEDYRVEILSRLVQLNGK